MDEISKKLGGVLSELKKLNQNLRSSRQGIICEKLHRIEFLQNSSMMEDRNCLREVRKEVDDLLEEEDLKWKQRSKEHWLQNGDRNTRYYHLCASQRKRNNQIYHIEAELGGRHLSQDALSASFFKYYKKIYSSAGCSKLESSIAYINQVVDVGMNESLLLPFST